MTPTPTAEERAKNALEFIGWGCGADVCEHLDCPSCGCMAYLAQAIREAEDAAYERAASVAKASFLGMSCFVDATDCGQFNSGVRHAAKAVASLKSPKEV